MFLALGGEGHAGGDKIALAALERFDEQAEIHVDDFQLDAQLVGDHLGEVDVDARELRILDVLKRREGGIGHHDDLALFLDGVKRGGRGLGRGTGSQAEDHHQAQGGGQCFFHERFPPISLFHALFSENGHSIHA